MGLYVINVLNFSCWDSGKSMEGLAGRGSSYILVSKVAGSSSTILDRLKRNYPVQRKANEISANELIQMQVLCLDSHLFTFEGTPSVLCTVHYDAQICTMWDLHYSAPHCRQCASLPNIVQATYFVCIIGYLWTVHMQNRFYIASIGRH